MHPLKRLLVESGYLRFYLAFGDGNRRTMAWRMHKSKLGEPAQTLVRLFLLKEWVDTAGVRRILGSALFSQLSQVGVLAEKDGATHANGFLLISFHSILVFFQRLADPSVYFGGDSVALALYQTRVPEGVTLDLCAGSGIQPMLAALHARQSIGVEINPLAARVATFNCALNGLENKVTIVNQPLEQYGRKGRQRFDLVTFNPPLLPMPRDTKYPFVGHGGDDGLDVTRTIMKLYLPRLTPTGGMEFIGCGLGRSGDYQFAKELERTCRPLKAGGYVQIMGTGKLEEDCPMYDSLVVTIMGHNPWSLKECYERCARHWEKLGVDEMYMFVARLDRQPAHRGTVKVLDLSGSTPDWIVRSKDY